MSFLISFRAEIIKVKRTAALKLCIVASALLPLMLFLEFFEENPKASKGVAWNTFFYEGRQGLNFAFLPLYIILVSTLLLQVEYRDRTWKQVLTSPQKLGNIFFAKFVFLQLLIILFLFLYNVWQAITGAAVEILYPDLFTGGFDFTGLLISNIQIYLLVFAMSSIQFWLSLRFKNFIVPIAIGFVLWLMAPLMIFEFHWSIADKYPYSYSLLSVLPKYKANIVTYQWYSLANAAFFLSIALIEFSIRKVKATL
jgi:hypothetical protein